MKLFLIRFFKILLLFTTPNFVIGIYRLQKRDESLVYTQNLQNNRFIFNYPEKTTWETYQSSHLKSGDLSEKKIRIPPGYYRFDEYGFSNNYPNSSPRIILIGDSYFHDPGNGTNSGFQASIDRKIGKRVTYNLGAVMNSSFKTYNELSLLKKINAPPKLIVLEVVERNFYQHWRTLYIDLINKKTKREQNHFLGLDLLFANNIKNFKFPVNQKTKEQVLMSSNTKEQMCFLNNRTSKFDEVEIKRTVDDLKKCQIELLKSNCKLLVIVVPDKETCYPQIFGKSSYNEIMTEMNKQQINHFNLLPYFSKNPQYFYYLYDTHWNQNAINLVTDLISDYYKENTQGLPH
jgi:hypothetical protein